MSEILLLRCFVVLLIVPPIYLVLVLNVYKKWSTLQLLPVALYVLLYLCNRQLFYMYDDG